MTSWKDAVGDAVTDGWTVLETPLPDYSEEDTVKIIGSCEQNLCGNYGTNWGCPPGWTVRMDVLGSRYESAILMMKRFEIDIKDGKRLKEAMNEVRSTVRSVVRTLRAGGFDCMGFADGECGYCGICSYPEPCRFPNQLVPSISSTGTDMSRYLKKIGKTLEFADDSVTFYGVVMFRRPVACSENVAP